MSMLKVIGWVAMGGLLLAGSIGGVLWWQKRQRKDASPMPSNPPRKKAEPADAAPARNQRQHTMLRREDLSPEIIEDFDAMFGEGWPATDEAIDKLEHGDVIVFVAKSEATEDFDLPKQEIINASVLTVGVNQIRARVIPPIAHAEHFGNSAGHGLYVGALVEVPRSRVMVAARRDVDPDAPASGYGSKGEPAQIFKPSGRNGQPFRVHPSTVYELELPYVTENLRWVPSRELVKFHQIGTHGLRHQIMFTEASVRGPYSVTLLDDDEREGTVFVAKWEFELAE